MNIEQLAQQIKQLRDEELQELVTHLSHDYKDTIEPVQSSTMAAMIYSFNTSRALIAQRDFTLREQAAMAHIE